MRKRILMIQRGEESLGVSADIASYYSFFTSPIGGGWYHDEIEILRNTDRRRFFNAIDEVDRIGYDYFIVIFSGHGYEASDGTTLAINKYERISIRDLRGVSPRQVIIADCSRSYIPVPNIAPTPTMFSINRGLLREAYENQILYSAPQEIILYACDEGETAGGTYAGGTYSQHLIFAARMASTDFASPFVSVPYAHCKAVSLMQTSPRMRQHPQISQSACLPGRHIPFGVNSNHWMRCDY